MIARATGDQPVRTGGSSSSAHFAFIAPPFLGHMNPMLALACELAARGHRATFLHQADAGRLLEGTPFGFVPLGAETHPPGHLAGVLNRMARVNGLFGIGGVIRDVVGATEMLSHELPDVCRSLGIDLIVADQLETAGGLVARHLDMPFVSVANALPLNREAAVPPPFTGWRYDPSRWGRERNQGGYRVSDFLMRRHARVIADAAARWRLGRLRTIEECASPFAQISQTVAEFDFPRAKLPASFHHVGPLRSGRVADHFRMPRLDDRPLVYASLGTLQGHRLPLLQTIAEAASRLDVQLILTHGGKLSPGEVATLSGRPHVFDFVPQDRVLARADLAVLHGGLNTVMDALAAGVPILCLPIAFEQDAVASRLVRAGAGVRVASRRLSARSLAERMSHVLGEPDYRDAARQLSVAIAKAGGVRRAADIVEAVLRSGRPFLGGERTEDRAASSEALATP